MHAKKDKVTPIWFLKTAATAVGISLAINYCLLAKNYFIFGSTSNPKYTIAAKGEMKSSTLSEDIVYLTAPYKRMKEIEASVGELEKKVEELAKGRGSCSGKNPANLERLFSNLECAVIRTGLSRNLSELARLRASLAGKGGGYDIKKDIIDNYYTKNPDAEKLPESFARDKEKEYGKFGDVAFEVFEGLTGKEVPDGLKIYMGDAEKRYGKMGLHTPQFNRIYLKDAGYELSMYCLLHELGHACYLGGEDFLRWLPISLLDYYDTDTMEECAGYLFVVAGIEEMKKKRPALAEKISTLLGNDRINRIFQYQNSGYESHPAGWALAEAMMKHNSNDPKKAFNMLSRCASFSQLPQAVLDDYKAMKTTIPVKTEIFETEYKKLEERCYILRGKCRDIINKNRNNN